ncbi:hypothetical protein JCM10212_005897 [Sporobolomyces blumeae]
MTTTLYDADGDGYVDSVTYDVGVGYDGYGLGDGVGYGYTGGYGLEGELPGAWTEYGDEYASHGVGLGLGGIDVDPYFSDPHYSSASEWDSGRFDLDAYTDWIGYDDHVPIFDAWGQDRWDESQYSFADLLWFQRQLELDHTLSEAERLRRWEARLAWEELEEEERLARYRSYDHDHLSSLGLADGFWARRFGNRHDLDLSHLRTVPIRRGIFDPLYRRSFMSRPGLGRRYQPLFSRSRLVGLSSSQRRLSSYLPPHGALDTITPTPAAHYRSSLIEKQPGAYGPSGAVGNVRTQELMSRLRIAELRASLTSLPPSARSQAVSDARHLRHLLNSEQRLSRDLDRGHARLDVGDEVRELQGIERERELGMLAGRY